MIALIDEFKKELGDIAEYAPSTVENYTACIAAFFDYARNRSCSGVRPNQPTVITD